MHMSAPTPALLPDSTIRRALDEFGVHVSDHQVAQIKKFIPLLMRWNESINLTAIRDPREMLYRHFCESMFAGIAVPVENGRLADVGSGGGFPGLPLKILRPDLEIVLIESSAKKATFLAEVTRDLQLTGVRVLVSRYQELGEELGRLDFVCSRALGEFGQFLAWAHSKVIVSKEVILWIGERDLEEIRKIPGWAWRAPIPVPQSLRRLILAGSRVDN